MLKTLNWYIAKNFIFTFLTAMFVLVFGMAGARLFKVFQLIANGVDAGVALTFVVYVLPVALALTIPWAALVSIMLVFGRLSADNEITAMRACGISILQIVAPIITICFCLTCLCLYLQMDAGPYFLGKSRVLIQRVAIDQPLALFEPGMQIEFENLQLMFDSKNSETGEIRGVQFYRVLKDGYASEDVTAARGKITVDRKNQTMRITLYDATISVYDNPSDITPKRSFSKESSIEIEYGKRLNNQNIANKAKFENWHQLYARVIIERERGDNVTVAELQTELNQRIAFSLAPMAFLLLGLPLSIMASRKETSVGLFMSVGLGGIYYFVVLISDALSSTPAAHPELVVWIPPVLYHIFGIFYICKIARR